MNANAQRRQCLQSPSKIGRDIEVIHDQFDQWAGLRKTLCRCLGACTWVQEYAQSPHVYPVCAWCMMRIMVSRNEHLACAARASIHDGSFLSYTFPSFIIRAILKKRKGLMALMILSWPPPTASPAPVYMRKCSYYAFMLSYMNEAVHTNVSATIDVGVRCTHGWSFCIDACIALHCLQERMFWRTCGFVSIYV